MKQSDLYLILASVYAASNCGPIFGVCATFLMIGAWFFFRNSENEP